LNNERERYPALDGVKPWIPTACHEGEAVEVGVGVKVEVAVVE